MNFGMASGANSYSGNRGPAPNANAGPLETVRAEFSLNQIVSVALPFNTPRAARVRQFVQTRILDNNNRRILIWRRETNNNWTNIDLTSTASNPVLTAPPAEVARKLQNILSTCPDVQEVVMVDARDGNRLTAEQVEALPFVGLGESAVEEEAPAPVDAAPVTTSMIDQKLSDTFSKVEEVAQAQKRDMVQFKDEVLAKLVYIIDVLEGNPRTGDPSSRRRRYISPVPDDDEDDDDDPDAAEPALDVNADDGAGAVPVARSSRATAASRRRRR